MLPQADFDEVYLEAETELDEAFDEFYREFLGEQAPVLAALEQRFRPPKTGQAIVPLRDAMMRQSGEV